MKKMLLLFMALVLCIGLIGNVSAASSNVPMFKVDGKLLVTPIGEPQPYINRDNRTMGSLRLIATAVGVESKNIKWDNAKQVATLTRGSNTVSVTVGKKIIIVNGKSVTMDTVAEMKQGRVFIPARFIAQGLGVTIKFESATNSVHFITKQEGKIENDNFEDYGLTRKISLPYTLETSDGLKLTIHSAYLYKTSSAEAKSLQAKYDFTRFDTARDILFFNFTLENNTGKVVQYNYHDMNPKLNVVTNRGLGMTQAVSSNYRSDNNTTYLREFRLEAGEKITSNMAFFNIDSTTIEFIAIGVTNKAENKIETFSEKVN